VRDFDSGEAKGGTVDANAENGEVNEEGRRVRYPGVYASMMTFFGGSRACIAFKFAEMEIKQVVSALLQSFHLAEPSDKELRWKMNGLQVPSWRWREHAEDEGDRDRSTPLIFRKVREGDFA